MWGGASFMKVFCIIIYAFLNSSDYVIVEEKYLLHYYMLHREHCAAFSITVCSLLAQTF